ncbi:MAG: hypothetical protein KAX13_10785 [Candidatus Krumholzibacteria bacterium]|nr:hypothetical protein [Candidatus Krumholzibacteria bacterium]
MRPRLRKLLLFSAAVSVVGLPAGASAQRDAREILKDHSAILQAGDLSIRFIYLHPDSLGREVAKTVLTANEYDRYEQEKARLPRNWNLLAIRVVPYRDARFDPTLITLTQREITHTIGFMNVVDVEGLFNSTLQRGNYSFGFLKVPERIEFKRTVTFRYERHKTDFLLPLKWRRKYFQFLDSPGR